MAKRLGIMHVQNHYDRTPGPRLAVDRRCAGGTQMGESKGFEVENEKATKLIKANADPSYFGAESGIGGIARAGRLQGLGYNEKIQECRAARIGMAVADHPKMVVAKTAIGASRVITNPIGEQLPRIC